MNSVNVNIDDDYWLNLGDLESWLKFLDTLFSKTIKKKYFGSKDFSVNLLLTNDENIRELNRNFRGNDVPTNVLSFPQYDSKDICKIDTIVVERNLILGDMAMSYGKIMRESKRFNFEFFDRCSHLFVHGVLHLFGMEHADSESEREMENLEIQVLSEFGMENPYILKGEEKNL